MKATVEQINAIAGEVPDPPLNYVPFLDSFFYQMERQAPPTKPEKPKSQSGEGWVAIIEWIGILVMFLIAGMIQ